MIYRTRMTRMRRIYTDVFLNYRKSAIIRIIRVIRVLFLI